MQTRPYRIIEKSSRIALENSINDLIKMGAVTIGGFQCIKNGKQYVYMQSVLLLEDDVKRKDVNDLYEVENFAEKEK